MARDLYDDHFKAVESMPRGVVVTLRNIATQLESSWELHTNRQCIEGVSGRLPGAGPAGAGAGGGGRLAAAGGEHGRADLPAAPRAVRTL